MIIYLCVKYELNTPMFSKDIKLKLFFNVEKGRNSKIISGFYPKSNLTYFIIICLCIKYESNSLIFSKVMEQKPFLKFEKGP